MLHLSPLQKIPRFLRVLASDYSQRQYGSAVRNFSDVPGKPIPAPVMVNGIAQKPMEGVSLAYTFDTANANAPSRHRTQ